MRHLRKINVVLLALGLFLFVQPVAAGDQVPFVGTLSGQVISAVPLDQTHLLFEVDVSGHATHLGRFTGEAEVVQNVADGSYVGSFTWIAANGDSDAGGVRQPGNFDRYGRDRTI